MKPNKKLRKKLYREYRIRARLWILREYLQRNRQRNNYLSLLALDFTMTSTRMSYLSNDYCTVASIPSQATTINRLIRTFEQIQKQANPFHVPLVFQNNQPIFVTQVHDAICVDLTKVVGTEDTTVQLYKLLRPLTFTGISE